MKQNLPMLMGRGEEHVKTLHAFNFSILACIALCAVTWAVESTAAREPAVPLDEADFIPLFNGKDLSGWEGDTRLWIVRDDMLIGRSTGIKHYSFLTTTQAFEDFVLRFQIKLVDGKGNTGVLFRSKRVPHSHEVAGYQADFAPGRHGNIYDESRRRKVLARPDAKVLEECLKRTDWNDYEIKAKGGRITLSINGVKLVDYVEPDTTIARRGLVALQIHKGKPMEVRFRNIRIKAGSTAHQPGEVIAVYRISNSWGYIHGLGWDGEQLWMTRYVYKSAGPVFGDNRVIYRVDIANAAPGSVLHSSQVLDLGWPSIEGCHHAGNHRLLVGPRERGSRESAKIIEVDDRTGARQWEYSEEQYTWPDGKTRGNYKDPDGIAFDGTHVYYLVKGDHENLGKAAVTVIRYSDKALVKRFWVPDESPVDIAFAGGWLIYKPRWRADRSNYPASNVVVFVDVNATPNGGNGVIAHTYEIRGIPPTRLRGGTEKFINWGAAHDGFEYLYVNRNNGWRAQGGVIYRIYCPLPARGCVESDKSVSN